MNQLSPIPAAQGNKKLLSARKVLLAIGIFLGISILLAAFNSATNQYSELHATYTSFYKHDGSGVPIGHYRIKTNSVYYYQNCSDPFNTWCKYKLDVVKPGEFQPLSKDFARVTNNNEVYIYHAHQNVTDKIANPNQFRALERIEINPRYFTDGVYVYYFTRHHGGKVLQSYGTENVNSDFPIKIEDGDTFSVPDEFQEEYYHYRTLAKKILFFNDSVYLNGSLVPSAEADSFQRVENNCLSNEVGPWFKDSTNVYYNGHILSDADPKTFILHEYSNFNDEKRDLDSCATNVVSDKSNVYNPTISFSANCDDGDEFCMLYEAVPGVSPKNMLVQTERIILGNKLISGERFADTIVNDDGVFYHDGSRKTEDMRARVYINRDWGKEYREINARKGSYNLYYWIYSPECKEVGHNQLFSTKTNETYQLQIDDRVVDSVSRCAGIVRTSLRQGVNSIELVSDGDEVLYRRDYEDVNR